MKHFVVMALLAAVVCCAGCGRTQDAEQDAKHKIAFVLKTLNHPFFIDMESGAMEVAEELNVDLVIQAAEREIDVERQMQIIENLIQTKIDALCVTPSGSKELVPVIKRANDAGIPVLIVDTRVDEQAAKEAGIRTETYIGSDNYAGGKTAGEFMVKYFDGKAKVAILEGIPGHETADQRMRGFQDAIKDHPGMEIVASQPANWERGLGYNVFENMMTAHPEIEALFACSDLMALGAVEAIRAAGKMEQIKVVGFDAIGDARNAIKEGTMIGSVAQYPDEMGRVAIENAVKVLNGETIPDYLPVKIEMISKDNL